MSVWIKLRVSEIGGNALLKPLSDEVFEPFGLVVAACPGKMPATCRLWAKLQQSYALKYIFAAFKA
jgi:hypothetical protein